MEVVLENQLLRVEISAIGAELMSIYHKETGRECMWNGDPTVWGRRSPILFPNCGAIKDGKWNIGGTDYPAKQHGFARDLMHKVVCATEDLATFRLEATDETLAEYPFRFTLKTTYKLEKNILLCKHKVINYDDKPIYFSFGFHTGLACPFIPGTKNTDYQMVFEKLEDCVCLTSTDKGLIRTEEQRYHPESRRIPVTPGIFTSSLILKNPQSKYIQLEEKKSGDYIRIHETNAPYTVLWSVPDDIKAVCIEPWHGIGDGENCDGVIEHKEGINCLAPMGEFVCSQSIEIAMSK